MSYGEIKKGISPLIIESTLLLLLLVFWGGGGGGHDFLINPLNPMPPLQAIDRKTRVPVDLHLYPYNLQEFTG